MWHTELGAPAAAAAHRNPNSASSRRARAEIKPGAMPRALMGLLCPQVPELLWGCGEQQRKLTVATGIRKTQTGKAKEDSTLVFSPLLPRSAFLEARVFSAQGTISEVMLR